MNNTDLKMRFLVALRSKDVELTEDLYRRMPACEEVHHLNNYFHGLLAQYTTNTIDLRLELVNTSDFDSWYSVFISKIFPYLSKKRLPSCTDSHVLPIYSVAAK